jgi:hypothetical protein
VNSEKNRRQKATTFINHLTRQPADFEHSVECKEFITL